MAVFVSFLGDANDISTFGGTSFFFLQALKEFEPAARGLDLPPPRDYNWKRNSWYLKEAALLRGIGGYIYSDQYLDEIWRLEMPRLSAGVIINMFQLFNPLLFENRALKKVFYIDQTLLQLNENYSKEGKWVSSYHRDWSMRRERQQYQEADLVLCMCQWAADSVVNDYHIAADRVSVVHPGGNIDPTLLPWFARGNASPQSRPGAESNETRPLRFVFVGMDPVRKGLFRFLDAMGLVPGVEGRMRLVVIGPSRDSVPVKYRSMAGVEWLGRISKNQQSLKFVEVLQAQDIGILLSTGEATGISLREFQMLGLGLLAPNVGGSPEMVDPNAAFLIEKTDGPEEIASVIQNLLDNPHIVAKMKEASRNARERMTWRVAAQGVVGILKDRKLL